MGRAQIERHSQNTKPKARMPLSTRLKEAERARCEGGDGFKTRIRDQPLRNKIDFMIRA
jgi:hypothetical protein